MSGSERFVAFGVFAVLSACGPSAQEPTTAAARGLTLTPYEQGLKVTGSGLEIGFGRAAPGAVAAVARVLGTSPETRQVSNTCTQHTWRSGEVMETRAGSFVAWKDAEGAVWGQVCSG